MPYLACKLAFNRFSPRCSCPVWAPSQRIEGGGRAEMRPPPGPCEYPAFWSRQGGTDLSRPLACEASA